MAAWVGALPYLISATQKDSRRCWWVNIWLCNWTGQVLDVLARHVSAGHDANIMVLVGLHVPTMVYEISSLLDVETQGLKQTDDVAFASSKAFHQRSDTCVILPVDKLCIFGWRSLFATTDEVAQVHGENGQALLQVYTGGPS